MSQYDVLLILAGVIVAVNTALEVWDRLTGKEKCDIGVLQKSFYELTNNLNCTITELRMLIKQTTKDIASHDGTIDEHERALNDHEKRISVLESKAGE